MSIVNLAKNDSLDLYSFILYCLGFFLFWEWLRPLQFVMPYQTAALFLLFSIFVFLLSYLRAPAILAIPLLGMAMLYTIHSLHFDGSFFQMDWMMEFGWHLFYFFQMLLAAQFYEMTEVARTFLFLLLFCFIGYLMRHWLLRRRNVFPFIFMTVVYAAVIDTFTPYDASYAIIRIVVLGFVLIGMLQVVKIHEQEGFYSRSRFPFTWFALVFIMIAFAIAVGFLAPKAEPQWADPVPFLKSAANLDDEETMANPARKSGYSENDEQLGGPFQLDETPVFYADIEHVHYWRAETKDFYTGKGWQASNGVMQPFSGELSTPLYEEKTKLEEKEAAIEMAGFQAFSFLFYEGQLKNVAVNGRSLPLLENTLTGKVSTENEIVQTYSFRYDYPIFSIEALRKSGERPYPSEIERYYLQLPDSLPDRVRALAEEITKDDETAYDKAKAIEAYFSGNGYVYETKDVAMPGRNDDYVDQFLFETKRGYCDNFSSSMAVMLRSIGIPARWVKGFTGGEFQEMIGDGKRRHLIKNEHAHSWVEVYFPGSGWVPFEPTKGFANPASFVSTFADDTDAAEQALQRSERDEANEREESSEQTAKPAPSVFSKLKMPLLLVGLSAFLVLAVLLWIARRRIAAWRIKKRLRKKPNGASFDERYIHLLALLSIQGFSRKPEQTLREFAREVDKMLETGSMLPLTEAYEEQVYSRDQRFDQKNEVEKHWETMMKKLSY